MQVVKLLCIKQNYITPSKTPNYITFTFHYLADACPKWRANEVQSKPNVQNTTCYRNYWTLGVLVETFLNFGESQASWALKIHSQLDLLHALLTYNVTDVVCYESGGHLRPKLSWADNHNTKGSESCVWKYFGFYVGDVKVANKDKAVCWLRTKQLSL